MMKNIVYFIILSLILISCSKDNTDDKDSIIGKWQLIEYCLSDGSVGGELNDCIEVENGYIFQFNDDGSFTKQNDLSICVSGAFTYDETDVFLEYESDIGCPLIGDTYILDYTFIENKLVLSPSAENNTCDEGCAERFKKNLAE